jgi:hypothetical protein
LVVVGKRPTRETDRGGAVVVQFEPVCTVAVGIEQTAVVFRDKLRNHHLRLGADGGEQERGEDQRLHGSSRDGGVLSMSYKSVAG